MEVAFSSARHVKNPTRHLKINLGETGIFGYSFRLRYCEECKTDFEVTHHLSTWQLQRFCVSALAEDELTAAAIHMADCQVCHKRFVTELNRQRGSIPFGFTLEPEFWFRDDHVDFDLLVGLADETLDQETQEIINIHLKTCETCREDVRSFLAFRKATAREMKVSYARPNYESAGDIPLAAPWWHRLQKTPVYAAATILLVAAVLVVGVIVLNKRSATHEVSKNDETNLANERTSSPSPSLSPDAVASPSIVDDSTKVAILKDGPGEITIDKNGRVTGVDEVSENSRQQIARAALTERIEAAEVLKSLAGGKSGLRGDDNPGKEFRLLYPKRSVVVENTPVFKWESLSGATAYRVYVLDLNGNQVTQSQDLPSNQTEWKTETPLRRGQIYSWAVTAVVDGKEIVSPSASAPEMKFAILSTGDLQELKRLKNINSHLALGIFYAKAGLLTEADREFQKLIELNPQSELPRKLLQSLRNLRKAN